MSLDLPSDLRVALGVFSISGDTTFRRAATGASAALNKVGIAPQTQIKKVLTGSSNTGFNCPRDFFGYRIPKKSTFLGLDPAGLMLCPHEEAKNFPGLPTPERGQKGRLELLTTSFRDYERAIREQFVEMFSRSGLDPRRDIAGVILNLLGHAFVNPALGFFRG